jgi:DNA modification methylase
MVAFRRFLGDNDMLAYLSMMAPRLVELRRVMKPTASIYLHCDPAASHYLKIILDGVFGPTHFLNEVIWKRTGSHGGSRRWGPVHDSILVYATSDSHRWNRVFQDYDPDYLAKFYRLKDDRGHYQLVSLTGAGIRTGDSGKPWRGVDPTGTGRHWAVPSGALARAFPTTDVTALSTQEKLDLLDRAGLIAWPERGSVPRQKRYADENAGVQLQDVITDIGPLASHAADRLGYPTQKPVELLKRIIEASSNPGDVVLDPFCGCGTTVDAAQALGRRWIGIDITHLAIGLIKSRLRETYGESTSFKVIGEPTTVDGAEALAAADPYQFQFWALGLVGARPVEQKKGADRGIDGRLYFNEGTGDTKQIIISVKAGKLQPTYVDALVGVVQKEGAQIGVLISFNEPTKAMRGVAASAGFYESPTWGRFPAIQLLTVTELLEGRGIDYPRVRGANVTYKKAQAAKVSAGDQLPLVAEGGPDEPYGEPYGEPDSDDSVPW